MKYSVFVAFLLFSMLIENKTINAGNCCGGEEDPEKKPLVRGNEAKPSPKKKKSPVTFDPPQSTATVVAGPVTEDETVESETNFTRVDLGDRQSVQQNQAKIYIPRDAFVVQDGENRIIKIPQLCIFYLYPDSESAEEKHAKVMKSLNKDGAKPEDWEAAESRLAVIYKDIEELGLRSGLQGSASELVTALRDTVALLPRETVPIRIARDNVRAISRVLFENGEARMLIAVPEPMNSKKETE